MSVYPYEIPLIYMDSENQNGMGGIDIIYKKEIVSKIPGKGADLCLSLNSKSADQKAKAVTHERTKLASLSIPKNLVPS